MGAFWLQLEMWHLPPSAVGYGELSLQLNTHSMAMKLEENVGHMEWGGWAMPGRYTRAIRPTTLRGIFKPTKTFRGEQSTDKNPTTDG